MVSRILNEKERELLRILQDKFPLENNPWELIASRLKITPEEVLFLIKSLIKRGFIKRIGAILDPKVLGFNSTALVAMKVPNNEIEKIAGLINNLDQVTHNFQRKYDYNLWFTLVCRDDEELKKVLEEVQRLTGIKDMIVLHTIREFKLKTQLKI